MAEAPLLCGAPGFRGTDGRSSSLAEALRANAGARLTGRLCAEDGGGHCVVFFEAGEIVHAELGDRSGEEAFGEILASRPGPWRFWPGPAGARRTIHKNWQQLLFESQWRLERRRAALRGREPTPEARPESPGAHRLAAELRRIPGVAGAVARLEGAPLEEVGGDETALARQARYLAVFARQLGSIFDAGDVMSAAAHGDGGHLLFIARGDLSVGVLVEGARELAAAEPAIREVLDGATR